MHKIPRLDIMIAYSCNIACRGCISISDQKRNGIEPFERIVADLDIWKNYIQPDVATIFGGEPCLHPRLLDISKTIRNAWPNATIRLITNGYLLDNFDSDAWFDLGNFEIQVSVHRKDHESIINKKIKQILQHRQPWTVSIDQRPGHHKQMQWQHNDLKIYKSIFKDFIVPYQQSGDKILPWNSDPNKAHKICGAPSTPVLYKGKLYKCPPVANAIDITNENWFKYRAVAPNDNIEDFVASIGKPELVCGQCPDNTQAVIINHFDIKNVTVKQKNLG